MTKVQKINAFCSAVLQIAAFLLLMIYWGEQLDALLFALFRETPYIVYLGTSLFLMLFVCRTMGCLVFMPKTKLRAILQNGDEQAALSQKIRRLFALPFIGRIIGYTVFFIAEFALRLYSISLFLVIINNAVPLLAKTAAFSYLLTDILVLLLAFAVTELPSFLLFYKVSLKGHPNRIPEYKFGLKLSLYVMILTGVRMALMKIMPASLDASAFALLVIVGFVLWRLMYRRKGCPCCGHTCPICALLSKVFSKFKTCRLESEQTELQQDFENAEKAVETIIKAETGESTLTDEK